MFWAKTLPCKIAVTRIATTENPNPVTDAGDVETGRRAVIQACKLEFRIMRCELADHEWVAVSRMLPNKPRGVPQRIAYWVVLTRPSRGASSQTAKPWPISECLRAVRCWI